jgi:hypothetical protein
MNQSFLVGMDLSNMAHYFFNFLEKYLKKFFVLPGLPSNEKNSSDHHNSYYKIIKKSYHIFLLQQHAQNSKGQNLASQDFRG